MVGSPNREKKIAGKKGGGGLRGRRESDSMGDQSLFGNE